MNYRNEDPSKNKYNLPYNPPRGAEGGQTTNIRKEQHWAERKKKIVAKKLFSKRLCKDIENISLPDNTPVPNLPDGDGCFIHGKASTGKTVLAANMLLDVKKHLWLNFQNRRCLFTSVPKLFARLKESFDAKEGEQTEWQIMEQHQETWLLVLDDFGVGNKPSDWLLNKLYLLINHRYEQMLPTFFTSNLDLKELSELFGDVRITSRIDRMTTSFQKQHWRNS